MSNLKQVMRQNWSGNFAYAPPLEPAIINLDEVVSVVKVNPEDTRGSGPFVCVKFKDGSTMNCLGSPGDFVQESKS